MTQNKTYRKNRRIKSYRRRRYKITNKTKRVPRKKLRRTKRMKGGLSKWGKVGLAAAGLAATTAAGLGAKYMYSKEQEFKNKWGGRHDELKDIMGEINLKDKLGFTLEDWIFSIDEPVTAQCCRCSLCCCTSSRGSTICLRRSLRRFATCR